MVAVIPIGHEGGIAFIDIRVVFGCHIAPASPCFVAYAPVPHLPGHFTPVLPSPFGHWADALKIDILHPLDQFLHGAAAHVAGEVGISADAFAHVEEIVCTETIVFSDA